MREFLANRYQDAKPVFSPLFLYYLERQMDGDLSGGDTGSTGRTACKTMNQFGICLEPQDPYKIDIFQNPPTIADVQQAALYKAGAYHALSNIQDMKSCLASGYGFIVGFTVYESFEAPSTATSGIMPVPNKATEQVLGGHEVFFCGYDDSKQAFEVQNSWGTGWGNGGYFWFPYTCANDPSVLMDAFIQHLGKPW